MSKQNFRAPAVPLVTHDPFFSVWSFSDKLNEDVTRHWDGVRKFMFGFVTVDKVIYEFLGKIGATDERYIGGFRKIPQTGCEIRPMTTVYTFENDLIKLEVTFTSPLLLNDLMILSRPVSYIDYKVEVKDGKAHDIGVHFGFSGEFCVNEPTQEVWTDVTPYSVYFTSGTENMLKRSGDDHRIEWGSFHAVTLDHAIEVMPLRRYWSKLAADYSDKNYPINPLPCQGPNRECANPHACRQQVKYSVVKDQPVITLRKQFPGVTGSFKGGIAVAYDDVKSLRYFGENIDAYWKKDGDDFGQMIRKAIDEHDEVLQKVAAFEKELLEKARAVSDKYADIVSLAYRQAIAGHKLTWHDGEVQFVSKENYSNGCAGTVDVTYPSIPLFLIYCPELVEGMLNPIFKMIDKGLWYYEFAPHDVGTYPIADGQVYGYTFRHRGLSADPTDRQMPIEECGNMLLCVAALCFAKKDMSYFKKHMEILTQWADYLVKMGHDPENQLCTDDFAGHLAHNCNLSVKAICGLEAYAMMLCKAGKKKEGAKYDAIAREFAKKWEAEADDGEWYRLAFDQPGTWSLKYNMVWDKLLHMDLFSKEVYEKELACYKQKFNAYGIPLDCRGDSTKTDWEMWTTVLFDDAEYTNMLVDAMWKWLNETPERYPFSDLVFTTEPLVRAFIARTVQGGLFINLLRF